MGLEIKACLKSPPVLGMFGHAYALFVVVLREGNKRKHPPSATMMPSSCTRRGVELDCSLTAPNNSVTPSARPPPPAQPPETTTATIKYAVYFNTLPVHLWGRQGGDIGGDAGGASPRVASRTAPPRRVSHAWSQVAFVPEHPGEILFVQGWSCRVLWARLPEGEGPRKMATTALSGWSRSGLEFVEQGAAASGVGGGGRFGLVDGSRISALDGHKTQVGNLTSRWRWRRRARMEWWQTERHSHEERQRGRDMK